jgi:two-component system response regulator RegX3
MTDLISAPHETPTGRRPLVLVVDDEISYRDALTSGLNSEGFEVIEAADGAEAVRFFDEHSPDLVLLDVMLPDRSGTEICRELRSRSSVPIVMVSARSEEIDIVVGLELGATDYVAKPFRFRELVARIRAILRRGQESVSSDEVLTCGPVTMDASRHEVTVRGELVELSRKEFDLLWMLLSRSGMIVSRDECIDALWWDQDLLDSRTLDTHIKRLRRKIETDPAYPRHLLTIRGVGFRFDA